MDDSPRRLTAQTSARPTHQTYAELQRAYDFFNERLFVGILGQRLPPCVITLQREKATCGYFSQERFGNKAGELSHEIALNPSYFAVCPLVETMATLVHEMCHLWQHEFGSPGRSRYHNKQWGDAMESIGLMPSDTGRPGGKRTGDRMADYPIDGGHFLRACAELLTQDFEISWYDRFPATMVAPLDHTEVAVAAGVPAVAASVAGHAGVPVVRPPQAAAGDQPANRSNRRKYTCACLNNVWGKPGLKILCTICSTLYVDAEGGEVEAEAAQQLPDAPALASI